MERNFGAIGWRHVLPWSLGFLALFAAAHFVLAWAIEREVIKSGQRRVGARVDVGDTRVNLVGSRLSLSGIEIANPQAPLRNLLEAEHCVIQLDPAALLHKRVVVRNGAISGIRFGTERELSGELTGTDRGDGSNADDWLDESAARRAQDWLDQLHDRFDRRLVDQLESIRLADELVSRWPEQSAELERLVAGLRARTSEFNTQVRDAQENSLRHTDFLQRLPQEITRLRDQVAKLTRVVDELPNLAEDDREAITAARQHDEKLLREELRFDPIDANVLSAYLLQKQLKGPLADAVAWLRLVRRAVPAEPKTGDKRRHRGRDVTFVGCQRAPDVLIQQLQLSGTASIAGAPVEFTGRLVNIADEPTLYDRPIRLQLRTAGAMPLEIAAKIDRTRKVPRDELLIDCGSLRLPELSLGGASKFRLSLAPSVATLRVRLALDGERLSGDVELVQKNVQITPVEGEKLAGQPFDTELSATLAAIDGVTTRVAIGGTIDQPRCDVQSTLGSGVARALDRAIAGATTHYLEALLAESHERVEERLASLDRQIADAQSLLEPQLADTVDNLDQLTKKTAGERLSIDHLGRRLPADSLFR